MRLIDDGVLPADQWPRFAAARGLRRPPPPSASTLRVVAPVERQIVARTAVAESRNAGRSAVNCPASCLAYGIEQELVGIEAVARARAHRAHERDSRKAGPAPTSAQVAVPDIVRFAPAARCARPRGRSLHRTGRARPSPHARRTARNSFRCPSKVAPSGCGAPAETRMSALRNEEDRRQRRNDQAQSGRPWRRRVSRVPHCRHCCRHRSAASVLRTSRHAPANGTGMR